MSTPKSTRVNLAEGGRAARTRRHLLDTALRLFAEHGYEGVRVEDIAREAGLSRAAFYKHFAERDEIIGELLDRLLAPGPGAPGEPGAPGMTGAPAAGPADGGEPAGVEADELGTSGRHLDRAVGLLMRTAERMAAQEALARFVYSLPVRPTRGTGRARPAVFGGVAVLVDRAREAGEMREGLETELVVAHLARTFEAAMRDWAEGRASDAVAHLRLLLDLAIHGVTSPSAA